MRELHHVLVLHRDQFAGCSYVLFFGRRYVQRARISIDIISDTSRTELGCTVAAFLQREAWEGAIVVEGGRVASRSTLRRRRSVSPGLDAREVQLADSHGGENRCHRREKPPDSSHAPLSARASLNWSWKRTLLDRRVYRPDVERTVWYT